LLQKPNGPSEGTGGSSDSELNEDVPLHRTKEMSVIHLSREEAAVLEHRSASRSSTNTGPTVQSVTLNQQVPLKHAPPPPQQPIHLLQEQRKREEEDDEEEAEALKDVFPLAGDLLLDSADDLVDCIMKEEAEEADAESSSIHKRTSHSTDELTDILSTMPALPNMDGHDVEDLFKGVLTDESQESQSADSSAAGAHFPVPVGPAVTVRTAVGGPLSTTSPSTMVQGLQQQQQQQPPPPCSPYFSEYSSSPGFSPAFSEPPPSPWPSAVGGGGSMDHDDGPGGSSGGATANQRNALKWEADEALGLGATISAVLYANTNHPELKRDFPGRYFNLNL